MGRQQRNRHPANRLGQRRRSYRADTGTATRDTDLHRAGPDSPERGDESATVHRPPGQNSPFQS